MSPDENLLAVVGIHLFKIYTVHDDGHLEDFINIRSTKAANLNYSSSDVEFCPTDNKVLASASTNGSVVVWNITSSGRPKPIHVFKDHCRAVNRVNFHPTDQHLILSGSQDGQMKLFDYRRQESVGTFSSNSESVRDIQFNPHIPHYFAAGTDSCNVQLWDMRRPDKYERLITGHRDHVFALDWHPVDRHCIATASRDYTIKIWDVSEQSLTVTSAISTVAAVARVKWRPNHYYHLAR
ncbi:hypothetical protein HAZT_HAZT002733 [Hyalella azteca]|uniref:GATOR2 complex protein WDR24 n=1 Tax=Hyalella azteca TaxID=294128 RepID=A0A6A0GZN1_HYAAZ|nr:hypothetical protein HAZT_HAZT002733 [Hyalella azteca]